jgi:hypothetical protein
MNVYDLMLNPLATTGRSSNFLRLILAEAGSYGMPGDVIAVLDDVAAMLGYYDPVPRGQAAHLAGPLVNWRTHPRQPTIDSFVDVEKLAFKQRALIAFGGGKPGQMVGTAEIVCAMGNIIAGTAPPEYYEIYQWASLDVLSTLLGEKPEELLKDPSKQGWKLIADDEVVTPGGRLYQIYQTICTSIRREAIAVMEKRPNHPREYLRPLAAKLLEENTKLIAEADVSGMQELVPRIEESSATIRRMFPELGDAQEELSELEDAERATASP